MTTRAVEFSIFRYKPGHIDPPRFESFRIEAEEGMTVLDALERIRLTLDGSLMYRHSCHHSSCGTCACLVNGDRAPGVHHARAGTGDRHGKAGAAQGFRTGRRPGGANGGFFPRHRTGMVLPETIGVVRARSGGFGDGTSAVRSMHRMRVLRFGVPGNPVPPRTSWGRRPLPPFTTRWPKTTQDADELLQLTGSERGERWCERALACSRVCPTGVHPARHIADLRRELKKPLA